MTACLLTLAESLYEQIMMMYSFCLDTRCFIVEWGLIGALCVVRKSSVSVQTERAL